MPASTRETLLGRYHYDPLDRLVDCAPFDQEPIQGKTGTDLFRQKRI
jgi:hypothetical protein